MSTTDNLTPVELLSAMSVDILADSIMRETPLFGVLAADAVMQPQKPVEWGARVTEASTGGRTLTGALSNDDAGKIVGASLSIPDIYIKHQFQILKQQMVIATNNGKISAVRSPMRQAMQDAMDAFARKIQNVLYNADGTLDTTTNFGVFGLDAIVANPLDDSTATGTYAGVSRVTYPKWRSIRRRGSTPGTAEALTDMRMTQILRDRRVNGATYRPNNGSSLIIVTNDQIERDVLRKIYGALVDERGEYEGRVSKDVIPYVNYFVSGIPVISDVDCPDNTMYFLNRRKLAIYGFDQSEADVDNPNIEYVPLRYVDETGEEALETTLWVRIADVSDEHPDFLSFELTTRFQLVAFDPLDAVSKMEDVAHTL